MKHKGKEQSGSKKGLLIWGLVAILAVAGIVYWTTRPSPPSKYDDFAKCIANSSTTFYGAYWCPHCRAEKARFGTSEQYLPYVECSNPDGQSQNAYCNSKNISGYPTWEFKDGSRVSGEMELTELASKTGCVLPQ